MKTKIAALLFAVAAMLTTACEQQKWSDTKQLFPAEHAHAGHGDHGHEHKDDAHGAAAEGSEHKTPAAAHGEAKH